MKGADKGLPAVPGETADNPTGKVVKPSTDSNPSLTEVAPSPEDPMPVDAADGGKELRPSDAAPLPLAIIRTPGNSTSPTLNVSTETETLASHGSQPTAAAKAFATAAEMDRVNYKKTSEAGNDPASWAAMSSRSTPTEALKSDVSIATMPKYDDPDTLANEPPPRRGCR